MGAAKREAKSGGAAEGEAEGERRERGERGRRDASKGM